MTTQTQTQGQEDATEREAIERALRDYERALNASDLQAAVAAYHDDGVFMPDGGPSAEGKEQIRGAYQYVFGKLAFDVKFGLDELRQMGDHAIVRTTSLGSITLLANGTTHQEDVHREFFEFERRDGQWKIIRYMFNKPGPHQM